MGELDFFKSCLDALGWYKLRFATLTSLIEDIKFKHLDERIMLWLKKQDKKIIEITHECLANELGSSRAVISRLLKILESKGSVILHIGKIELK